MYSFYLLEAKGNIIPFGENVRLALKKCFSTLIQLNFWARQLFVAGLSYALAL